MRAVTILLVTTLLSGFALADTEYFGSELGIESYQISDWSDPANFTISNESEGSTGYFGTEFTIQGTNNDTGGGWFVENTASIITYLTFIGILFLLPLAFIAKYRNGRKVKRK